MKRCVTDFVMLSALALLLALPASAAAQTAAPAAGQSADELAKQTQNPIAGLISVPVQGNWDFGIGDRNATSTLFNFQPVVPFAISSKTNVVLRVIMPLTSQPGSTTDAPRINGMGDIVATVFFSPSQAGKLIWGVGPVLLLPTAVSNKLGSEKFGLGPSVVVLTQPGKWTLGLLANQIWSTSGAQDRTGVNSTYLQPFASYNLGKGLSAGIGLEASGNHKAEAGQQWTIPMLFTLSKVTLLGKRPVNLAVAAGPMIAHPTAGATWKFRMSATFLFPR